VLRFEGDCHDVFVLEKFGVDKVSIKDDSKSSLWVVSLISEKSNKEGYLNLVSFITRSIVANAVVCRWLCTVRHDCPHAGRQSAAVLGL
jgi:hypothetical protein